LDPAYQSRQRGSSPISGTIISSIVVNAGTPDYLYMIWTDVQIIAEFVGSGFQGVKNFV